MCGESDVITQRTVIYPDELSGCSAIESADDDSRFRGEQEGQRCQSLNNRSHGELQFNRGDEHIAVSGVGFAVD